MTAEELDIDDALSGGFLPDRSPDALPDLTQFRALPPLNQLLMAVCYYARAENRLGYLEGLRSRSKKNPRADSAWWSEKSDRERDKIARLALMLRDALAANQTLAQGGRLADAAGKQKGSAE